MVCHETYKDENKNWLSPDEVVSIEGNKYLKKNPSKKVIVGPSESMSKSKRNTVDPEKIIEINIHNDKVTTFSVIDVFVKIAAHIYRGGSIDLVGNQVFKLKELYNLNPILNEKSSEISGNVIYVDNYDNVVTNISKKTFI